MDISRPDIKRKKLRRQLIMAACAVVVLAAAAFFVLRLKPAAPEVERATVWTDVVKRGPLLRQVRGPGTLVPREDKIRLIPAETEATVVRIRVLPGAKVEPNTVLMDLVDPTLQQELLDLWQADRRTCIFVTHSVGEAAFLAETIVVLKAQPGRIDTVIQNTNPRPRDRTSDAYFAMYRKIDAALREEHEPLRQSVPA